MCGIFGTVGRMQHEGLREAALSLRHRGPDGFGDWASPDRNAYLAHCRLAIIDLSAAGRQPMGNEDGSIQLSFNGEIYNFEELRRELVAAGHVFASRTDSEVIVHGYEEWGDAVVSRLRGIFAFAIWDARRRCLLLARDHLGVKPLYYALRGRELAFASEPRALLPLQHGESQPDVDALLGFLRHGYVRGGRSIWQGISRLPPACTMVFEAERAVVRIERYWRPQIRHRDWTRAEALDAVQVLLDEAVQEELVSDVPVGVFLSGGIDSSLIAASARSRRDELDSFFVDFAGWSGSERADAARVAAHIGARHHVDEIAQDSLSLDNPERARELFMAFDEPIADPAIVPTWQLARRIRRHVGVALSGDGGDELFGGYTWYAQVRATARRRRAWQLERARRRVGFGRDWPQGCTSQSEYYHLLHCPSFNRRELGLLFPQWTAEVARLRAADWTGALRGAQAGSQQHWQLLDMQQYLVDNNLARVDRASMAHGLEVRVPLLDRRIVELALSLPQELLEAERGGKPLLRQLAVRRLPQDLLTKRKQGFSFPRSRLISEAAMFATLRTGALVREGVLSAAGLENWLHARRLSNHEFKLWLLFVLEKWARYWWLSKPVAA